MRAICWLGVVVFANVCVAQVAVEGETVYTMAGPPLKNAVVLIRDGKIAAIGAADEIKIPADMKRLKAKVVTPGLIDAHTVIGLSGVLNAAHDQDQLESSTPIQPALRALDAYNPREPLVGFVRGLGVTVLHTGHAPGELISGQTMVVKTRGNSVEAAIMVPNRAVACTLSSAARKSGTSSPGSRAKMLAMLRQLLIQADEYRAQVAKAEKEEDGSPPDRDLKLEVMASVLDGKRPLMITAERAQDIANALRLAREFQFTLWLDGASEAGQLVDEIKQAKVPVILHATMVRSTGDRENASFETAAKLKKAGVQVVMQSGYEPYVPKTRVVLFEAAMAAANGLSFEQALSMITVEPARLLGIDNRVGSIAIGKDGDLALYDGDPFEWTTHCTGVVIEGEVFEGGR